MMKKFKSQFDVLDSLEKRPETLQSLFGGGYDKLSSAYSCVVRMLHGLVKSGLVGKTSHNGTPHGRNSILVYYYVHKDYYLVFSKPLFSSIKLYYTKQKPVFKSESYMLKKAFSLEKRRNGMCWVSKGTIFIHVKNVRKIL